MIAISERKLKLEHIKYQELAQTTSVVLSVVTELTKLHVLIRKWISILSIVAGVKMDHVDREDKFLSLSMCQNEVRKLY